MQTHLPIGYKMVEGKIHIDLQKSDTVKKIYKKYVNGTSMLAIAKELKENEIPNANNKTSWTHGAVGKILQNTKYMGDDLYPPLISKDLFHKAQEKRKEKTAQLGRTAQLNSMNNHHAFTNRIFCGECGEPYRKYVEHCGKPQEKVRWKCKRYIFNNKVQCRNLFYTEEEIKAVVTSALNQLLRKRALLTTEYDEQIEKLQQQMLTLIEDNAKQGAISEDFDEEYHQLSEQINELKTVRIQVVQAQKKAKSYKERVDQLDKAIATVNPQVREFDQDLVKRLISSIRVHKGMKLEIQFHSGIVVKQEVDYYE